MTEPGSAPVVFVHGLWMHATSWTPWLELFTERGYAPVAPGWPGDADTVEATRANAAALTTAASPRSPTTTPRSSPGCRPSRS